MSWPQVVMVALMSADVMWTLAKHGQPRDDYHVGWNLLGNLAMAALLWAGGFWK